MDLELADLKAEIAEKTNQSQDAAARELELRKKARELEERQRTQAERIRGEVEERFRKDEADRIAQAAAAAETRAKEESAFALKGLRDDLAAQREKARIAQEAELVLRKEKGALEERGRALGLEVAGKLDAAKTDLEASIRKAAAEEQNFKYKEKEKQIADLRQALEDAKRRSDLGSQELQGEVLELDIQAALERQFPTDRIDPVIKAARGADIQQRVRNDLLEDCRLILWETKNARNSAPPGSTSSSRTGVPPAPPLRFLCPRLCPRGWRASGASRGSGSQACRPVRRSPLPCESSDGRCPCSCLLRGKERKDGVAVLVPLQYRLSPARRGYRRGLRSHADSAQPRAPCHGKAVGGVGEAGSAFDRKHLGHLWGIAGYRGRRSGNNPGTQVAGAFCSSTGAVFSLEPS